MSFHLQTNQASPRVFQRSAFGLLIMFICMLFAAGCSGGGSNGGFVASPSDNPGPGGGGGAGNGSVTFNFVKAQTAIVVPTNTTSLRFQFFTGLEGTGVVVLNETRPFAARVTFENVPTSVRSVKITALTAEGFPVREFSSTVLVTAGDDTVVDGAAGTTTPVTLQTVTAGPASLSLAVGGTATPVIQLNFSNDEFVRLTGSLVSEAIFSTSDGAVASVDPATGLVTGLLNGTAIITADIVDYPGQSVNIVTQVGTGIVTRSPITQLVVTPTGGDTFPLVLPVGTQSQPVVVTATYDNGTSEVVTKADGVEFSSTNLDFTVDNAQRVVLSKDALPTTSVATITVRYKDSSTTFKANPSAAVLETITVVPNAVSLPFGEFEQSLTVSGVFSDGRTVNVEPSATTLSQSPASPRYSVDDATDTIISAATPPVGGSATPQDLIVTAIIGAESSQATVSVTVGAIEVDSLSINPAPISLKPGQRQVFSVVANLNNGTTVDVSNFDALTISLANSDGSGTVYAVANGKQVVGVSPTPSGQPVLVTFTFAGESEVVEVTVLREFLTSVEYHFAGNPIQNQTVNLPRGYVGVFEVHGTFNTGVKRRLNFNEYRIEVAPGAVATDPFNMIREFADGYTIPQVRGRYFDGAMSDFDEPGLGPVDPNGPTGQNILAAGDLIIGNGTPSNPLGRPDEAVADDLYRGRARTVAPVSSTLVGSTFATVATRPTFRAIAADWPRGESNDGSFLTKSGEIGSLPDPDLNSIVDSLERLISPGANREVRLILEPNVDNPDNLGALDQTVSVTVTDPRSVDFVSAQFVNYPGENQTPIGSVREYEVRVTFAAVSSSDTVDADEPAVGPFVDAQTNFKLAEANCHIVSNFGGQNQFSVNTPTSLGFVGVYSDVTVDANTLNIVVTPLAGVGVRPIANTRPERRVNPGGPQDLFTPATYIYHDRVFGPSFELTLIEAPGRNLLYDPGPPIPDGNAQATRDPADGSVYNSIEQRDAPIKFVNPLLFSIDPINVGGNPVEIILGASQIFRTMVQFTENQAPVERTLDYLPTLVVNNASPALAGFGDAASGRLAVSAINTGAVGNVTAADVASSTGYGDLAAHPDVAAVLNTVRGIVISLDAAGRPIAKKGAWSNVVDSLGQNGPAQSVTTVDAVVAP